MLIVDETLHIADGIVVREPAADATTLDAAHQLVLPAMAEAHAHLDKAFLAETVPNPTGDLMGAIINIEAARDRITEADTEIPRSCSIFMKSDRVRRASPLART